LACFVAYHLLGDIGYSFRLLSWRGTVERQPCPLRSEISNTFMVLIRLHCVVASPNRDKKSQELANSGEPYKGIVIQETFYNDPQMQSHIKSAHLTANINILSLFQWPLNRDIRNKAFTSHYSPLFDQYGGPALSNGVILAPPCRLAPEQTTCATSIAWTSSYASGVSLFANGILFSSLETGSATIPWLTTTPINFELRSDQGTLAAIKLAALPPLQLFSSGTECLSRC
jgi:hypothetical protein